MANFQILREETLGANSTWKITQVQSKIAVERLSVVETQRGYVAAFELQLPKGWKNDPRRPRDLGSAIRASMDFFHSSKCPGVFQMSGRAIASSEKVEMRFVGLDELRVKAYWNGSRRDDSVLGNYDQFLVQWHPRNDPTKSQYAIVNLGSTSVKQILEKAISNSDATQWALALWQDSAWKQGMIINKRNVLDVAKLTAVYPMDIESATDVAVNDTPAEPTQPDAPQ